MSHFSSCIQERKILTCSLVWAAPPTLKEKKPSTTGVQAHYHVRPLARVFEAVVGVMLLLGPQGKLKRHELIEFARSGDGDSEVRLLRRSPTHNRVSPLKTLHAKENVPQHTFNQDHHRCSCGPVISSRPSKCSDGPCLATGNRIARQLRQDSEKRFYDRVRDSLRMRTIFTLIFDQEKHPNRVNNTIAILKCVM